MKSLSKWYLMLVIGVFLNNGCTNSIFNIDKEPFLTSEQRTLIRTFATQNGYAETVPLDSFVIYLYREWPYQSVIYDFYLTFPVQDTVPRTLVLTDVLTQIGKGLRVYHAEGGVVHPAYIDSIEIRTDSVIVVPWLDLEDCHLTHLPPQIGEKIRTKALDISFNNITYLPLEIMNIFSHLPADSGKIKIMSTPIDKSYWDSLPDTLKNWLRLHGSP
jgi:hypothetical protein